MLGYVGAELRIEHGILCRRIGQELLRRHASAEVLFGPRSDIRAHDLIGTIGTITAWRRRTLRLIVPAALDSLDGVAVRLASARRDKGIADLRTRPCSASLRALLLHDVRCGGRKALIGGVQRLLRHAKHATGLRRDLLEVRDDAVAGDPAKLSHQTAFLYW